MQKKISVLKESLTKELTMLKKIIDIVVLVAMAVIFAGMFVYGWSA